MLIKYPPLETWMGVDFTLVFLSSLPFCDGKWQAYVYVHIIHITLDYPSTSINNYHFNSTPTYLFWMWSVQPSQMNEE